MKELKFEQALDKLENTVKEMEEGNVSLDKSLELFEEGVKLAKFCSVKLREVEKKVEILKKDVNGAAYKEPFELNGNKK
ncbi:exodeoxyribonuclease VII small subunit [bacterium]|nr:exodeoxyribonuclease VII small subunit [bacterium]